MRKIFLFFLLFITVLSSRSQDMWKYFKPQDFAKRRAAVMKSIGDGIAILQAAELPEAYVKFRQDNNFYYLSGIEIPDAVLVLDGKEGKSFLLVPETMSGDIKEEAWIKPGKEAQELYQVDRVLPRKMLTRLLQNLAGSGRSIYVQTAPEETAGMSRDRCTLKRITHLEDPWDGRIAKETNFINKIKERFPVATVMDLTPIMDSLRWVKDEKEIALMRECGRIGALGFDEAMRVTRPGIYEYQVVAACDFVYQNEGAQNPAYFAIAASGERGLTWHYNANNHPMKEGDVILLDYAPDLNYYVTDITRTWPIKGTFNAKQLAFYDCIKEAEEKVIAAMKPGVTVKELEEIARAVYVKRGLEKYWPGYIGHFVGMSVHDVGPYDKPFVPGVVFNVEPIIEDKELKIHLRLEDTVLITPTGSENLTAGTPVDPKKIYALINEKGIYEKEKAGF